MRKTILAVALLAMTGSAFAQMHTLSVGYQRDTASDFDDLHPAGVNIAYDFNPYDTGLGLTASMSYTSASEETHYNIYGYHLKEKFELNKFSALIGPNWKFNDYLTVYGLVGYAQGEAKLTYSGIISDEYSETQSGFAYGAGVKVNITQAFSVRAGYEGAKLKDVKVNGFNIGVGYSF